MNHNIDLDKRTLAYGPVAKYYDIDLLNKDLEWYRDAGYKVYQLDAEKWYTIEDLHSACHEVFQFPGYYGRNWGAFDDVISEIDTGENGNVLICVLNYDSWHKMDSGNSQTFLDIMSDQTYSNLVGGRRFITLIQSSNPKFNVRDVGAKSVYWNWVEWDDRDRGVKS